MDTEQEIEKMAETLAIFTNSWQNMFTQTLLIFRDIDGHMLSE